MTDENSEQSEEQEERGFGEVAERELPEDEQDDSSQDEQVDTESEDSQEDESEQADDQQREEGNKGEDDEDGQKPKPEKTEKGTKLDPNPQSAVHQQLANEKRIRGQMEVVLADPAKLARFVKEQYGAEIVFKKRDTEPTDKENANEEQPAVTTKKWTAKDFENIEDVAEKFNQLQEDFSKKLSNRDALIDKLTKQVTGVMEGGRLERIADATAGDVTFLKSVPELNPKSPDFVPGLEGRISRQYRKLDFDEKTREFRGQYSLREIAEDMLDVVRDAKKAGSSRAQTIVRDKTGGRVRTSPAVDTEEDSDKLPPSESIAQGIRKMFKN